MVSVLSDKSTRQKVYDLLEQVNKTKDNFCIIPDQNDLGRLEHLLNAYSCNELTLEDVKKQVAKILADRN